MKTLLGALLCFVVVMAVCASPCGIYLWVAGGEKTIVVDRVVLKIYDQGSTAKDVRLIMTDRDGDFQNSNSAWKNKTNAEKLQKKLLDYRGKRVRIRYYGFRLKMFGVYPNVIDFEAIE